MFCWAKAFAFSPARSFGGFLFGMTVRLFPKFPMPLSRREALISTTGALGAAAASTPFARANAARELPFADFVSVADFEPAAASRLAGPSLALINGGAADEITVRWNREAYDQIRLKPRVLVDVSHVDTSVILLGATLPFPILLAPAAFHRMVHPVGEFETALGAAAAGALFVVSSASNTRVDKIASAGGPLWFQMYVQSDRTFVKEVLKEVEAAGCRALVVTVDAPVVGPRYRQLRARFKLTPGLELPYMADINRGRDSVNRGGNARVTWDDIAWLRANTRLPVLLKGILNPDDAVRAVEAQVAGIIVSNHGGRTLDTVPATITALPVIVEKVDGRIPVLVDGGVRRGTDVLKALALGANAVLIGRPYLHGLAVAGAAGVEKVVSILVTEFQQAMALSGRTSINAIDRSVLW
jgi:4-hydroxymandelate oxidase